MSTKPQHSPSYERLRGLLRRLREEADLTQRQLGEKLGKPQSWIYNCETGNPRVDVSEFVAWARACGCEPVDALEQFLELEQQAGEEDGKLPDK